jgi:hypothetical protein
MDLEPGACKEALRTVSPVDHEEIRARTVCQAAASQAVQAPGPVGGQRELRWPRRVE